MSCLNKIFRRKASFNVPIENDIVGLKITYYNDIVTKAPGTRSPSSLPPLNVTSPPPAIQIISENGIGKSSPPNKMPPKRPESPKVDGQNNEHVSVHKSSKKVYKKIDTISPPQHQQQEKIITVGDNKMLTQKSKNIKKSKSPIPPQPSHSKTPPTPQKHKIAPTPLTTPQPTTSSPTQTPQQIPILKLSSPISDRVRRKKVKQCVKVDPADEIKIHVDLKNANNNNKNKQPEKNQLPTKNRPQPQSPTTKQKTTKIDIDDTQMKNTNKIEKTKNLNEAVNTLNLTTLQVNTSPKAPKTPRGQRKQMTKVHSDETPKLKTKNDRLSPDDDNNADIISLLNEAKNISDDVFDGKSKNNRRKTGIISDRIEAQKSPADFKIDVFKKDPQTIELITKAIKSNDFLNIVMDKDRLEYVVNAMVPVEYTAHSYIVSEGDNGAHFYVSAEGDFQVIKNGEIKKSFGPGVLFGELAILYKAKRFASIKVTTNGKVWSLDRKTFQKIMMKTGSQEREQNIEFLSTVQVLKGLPINVLHKVADLLTREFYATGTVIIRQGDPGDKFYIIRGGSVTVTKKSHPSAEDKVVGVLERGKYFGEQALIKEDKRLANIIANDPGTECLTLNRVAFINYLGPLTEIFEDLTIEEPPKSNKEMVVISKEYDHIQLDDLEIVGTLGVGGFGRVELVQYQKKETFALKILKKYEVANQGQIEHAYSEKHIMATCDSAFIVKLYKTYRNSKYLYFLMEACLGGDVWTQLQKTKCFDDKTSKFVTACVVEAFDYLHARNIIYRDLKPENLMLDTDGYVKLVDFGFAKRISPNSKTWTFAGTPEYVAPEIILNKGHDRAVDYWALGVFVHELFVGKPPFRGKDHMKTYNLILRGIDSVQMPPKITKSAQGLIKSLCRQVTTDRLGYQKRGIMDIKKHSWFDHFDWEKLKNRTLSAPLKRPVRGPTDLSNFDEYPRERDDPPDENSGWDVHF